MVEDKKKEAVADNKKTAIPKNKSNTAANISKQANKDPQKNGGANKSVYGEKRKAFRSKKRNNRREQNQDEFEQKIVDLARVTRVMKGGKRMRFRACVAIGNRKGKVGLGMDKGADVAIAVNKAVTKAKKNIIDVPMTNETIPHEIYQKTGAAKILLKPARKGKGVIAGGAARIILELSGIKNISSKILGTNNNVNVAKSTVDALNNIKKVENSQKSKKKSDKKIEKNSVDKDKKNTVNKQVKK